MTQFTAVPAAIDAVSPRWSGDTLGETEVESYDEVIPLENLRRHFAL